MIEIGIKVSTVRLEEDAEVHVYKAHERKTLCGKDKRAGWGAGGEDASCQLCWGQLYLQMSLEIDSVFGYPTPEDVKDEEEEAA